MGWDEGVAAEREAGAEAAGEPAAEAGGGGPGCEDFRPFAAGVDLGPAPVVEQAGRVAAGQVGRCARPVVSSGAVDEAGADRIEVDVGESFDQVRLSDRARVEPVLPQMPAAPAEAVGAQGKAVVGLADGLGHRIVAGRDGDEVDVVGHQAPAEHVESVLAALEAKRVEVEEPIGVGEENGLAVVAALGDVVRYADRHHPRLPGHFGTLISASG